MNNFSSWLKTALPGSRFTYFVGTNTSDAATDDEREKIRAAFRWATEGKVMLFQQRQKTRRFSYIAIRAPRDLPASLIPLPIQVDLAGA
jgi:hypothetical protein